MYSYKINNSYTIYVNTTYINDCIKACKGTKPNRSPKHNLHNKITSIIKPLPIKTIIKHKTFGYGTVISTNKNIITVDFDSKTTSFIYPDALNQVFFSVIYSR